MGHETSEFLVIDMDMDGRKIRMRFGYNSKNRDYLFLKEFKKMIFFLYKVELEKKCLLFYEHNREECPVYALELPSAEFGEIMKKNEVVVSIFLPSELWAK